MSTQEQNTPTRQEGYYWIIPKRNNYFGMRGWQVAFWDSQHREFWTDEQDGCEFKEDDCERIHEVRIKEPDEQ